MVPGYPHSSHDSSAIEECFWSLSISWSSFSRPAVTVECRVADVFSRPFIEFINILHFQNFCYLKFLFVKASPGKTEKIWFHNEKLGANRDSFMIMPHCQGLNQNEQAEKGLDALASFIFRLLARGFYGLVEGSRRAKNNNKTKTQPQRAFRGYFRRARDLIWPN